MKGTKESGAYVFDPVGIDKRLTQATARILKDKDIHPKNKRLILDYIDYILTVKKLTKYRASRWFDSFVILGRFAEKPFSSMSVSDVRALDRRVLNCKCTGATKKKGEDLSDTTKGDLEKMIKCFWKWIKSPDKNSELDEFPPEVKWIRPIRTKTAPLKNEDTISHDDVIAIKNKSIQARDRAFAYTLWDSCDRIKEHLGLTVGDVEDLDEGVNLNVMVSKTGGNTFKKFLVLSSGDLKDWLRVHPKADDPKAPLWIRIDGRAPNAAIDYAYASKILRTLARRAGIKKAANPHNFRHGGLSFWSDHLTDSQIKYRAGWAASTKMFDVYIHKDLNVMQDAILQALDRKPKEETDPFKDKFKSCPVCGKQQDKTRTICFYCDAQMDQRKNELIRQLMEYVDRRILESAQGKHTKEGV